MDDEGNDWNRSAWVALAATDDADDRRELAYRTSDGIEVTLFWSKPSNQVTIAVLDTRSDEALEFEVDGSAALDAFNHPYAYAAAQHARTVAPLSVALTQ